MKILLQQSLLCFFFLLFLLFFSPFSSSSFFKAVLGLTSVYTSLAWGAKSMKSKIENQFLHSKTVHEKLRVSRMEHSLELSALYPSWAYEYYSVLKYLILSCLCAFLFLTPKAFSIPHSLSSACSTATSTLKPNSGFISCLFY